MVSYEKYAPKIRLSGEIRDDYMCHVLESIMPRIDSVNKTPPFSPLSAQKKKKIYRTLFISLSTKRGTNHFSLRNTQFFIFSFFPLPSKIHSPRSFIVHRQIERLIISQRIRKICVWAVSKKFGPSGGAGGERTEL